MSRYFVHTPRIIQRLFPKVTWRKENSESVYLTFDDGPHAEVTPMLLELLREHNVRATFFLLGKNAEKYPELVKLIQEGNHTIGFHCNEHLNSRKLNRVSLLKNFKLPKYFPATVLFRPPYGKLKFWQYNFLKNKFALIGWTVMPGDFDQKIAFQKQLDRLKKVTPGDIVVLHELPNTIELLRIYFQQTEIKSFEKL
ncbi:MAG: polysaccharide deacetylase family protein [Flavobacteriales bacterium]|jgi:peptidoglycan-N-acetylglucosamine deacetylase|nr:polysaccharide deacetylase family protein [Flavobacteriales bacterium]MDP4716811.1 polysaccharide deacetylase family protein [Flavobacteriales bacterium]MDP4819323.1 polysaccharide deacetylase family protein [Flavobacteriales bacterium]MDP4951629.1 polysaccharide deacetylase family protein [Flavobacteriales bacterium]